jgi:hypothetical protein
MQPRSMGERREEATESRRSRGRPQNKLCRKVRLPAYAPVSVLLIVLWPLIHSYG